MRKINLTLLTLFINIVCHSQTIKPIQFPKKIGDPVSETQKLEIKGVSPSTAIFILKLRQESFSSKIIKSDSLKNLYGIKQLNGINYIGAFVIASDKANLIEYGFLEQTSNKKIKTGLIPIENLELIASDKHVSYVQINQKVNTTLDNALIETGVTQVHNGAGNLSQAYFGEGVVVGIIDGGFDYTHPSFYDTSYTNYRVKRVWEQNSISGTPPSGYSYGRELSDKTSILNAQRDMESESHGTHVAGTAAGSGVATKGACRGVAYKSDIVLVSTKMNDQDIFNGIDYIFKYANSVSKPCVINISIGGHFGPHDGTSLFDISCDASVGNGKIIVGSAGNEGSTPLHIGKSFTSTDSSLYTFIKFPNTTLGTNGSSVIDIWGTYNENFYVSVSILNTSTNKFEDWTPFIQANKTETYSYNLKDDDLLFPDDCLVDLSTEISPLNDKPHVYIQIDHTDQDDDYRWVVIGILAKNTDTKMWANGGEFTNNNYNLPFTNGSTSSTVGEVGGTGNSIITVGAYTTKNMYKNFSGNDNFIPSYTSTGEIASFSSHGPTADNRTKPDITAPGNVIIAPVSRFDSRYSNTAKETVYSVTDGTNIWNYAAMQGTSMASPMVTGIIALWLEAYPDLTPSQVLSLLKNNARTDTYTGIIPSKGSNIWGWGKIDAKNGLIDLESKIPKKPEISPNGDIQICEGESQDLIAPNGYTEYEWNNRDSTKSITISKAGEYSVRVKNNYGYFSSWSDKRKVIVKRKPNKPIISVDGEKLTSTPADAYQWYLNDVIIKNATQQTYLAQESGSFNVEVTNSNNCTAESDKVDVKISNAGMNTLKRNMLSIYPNPNEGIFTINSMLNQEITINLYNSLGKLVRSFPHIVNGKNQIELNNINQGIYFIKFELDGGIENKKLIIN